MRILTLNTGGGRIHPPLLDYLRHIDADILCLQEVVLASSAPTGWLDYRDGTLRLPQRARLYDELGDALPGHSGWFRPAERGPLYDADGRAFVSNFGLATFVKTSLKVSGQETGFIHGAYDASGWGGHPRARNAHVLRIHDPVAARWLTVGNLHGLRDPAGKHDTPARLAQARALAALVASVRQAGDEIVVAGDFNVLPDSETFAILAELGLSDLVTGGGHTDTRTSLYGGAERYADYCLVTPGLDIARFEVVAAPEISDHRPLLLEIA